MINIKMKIKAIKIINLKLTDHFKYNEDYSLTKVASLPIETKPEITTPTTDNALTFGDQYASHQRDLRSRLCS